MSTVSKYDASTGEVHLLDPRNNDICFVTVRVQGDDLYHYLCSDGKLWRTCVPTWEPNDSIPHNGYFPTHKEATFRLLLYQNPAQALAAFYKAAGGEYVGSCENCDGMGVTLEFGLIGGPAHGTPCPRVGYTHSSVDIPTLGGGRYERTVYERLRYRKGEVEREIWAARGLDPDYMTREVERNWSCPTCNGTGGPPSPADLAEISDWYAERGCEMEAEVLKDLVSK